MTLDSKNVTATTLQPESEGHGQLAGSLSFATADTLSCVVPYCEEQPHV